MLKDALYSWLLIALCLGLAPWALASPAVTLTAAERAQLGELGTLRLCVDPQFPPYEEIDGNGRYVGIGAELWAHYGEFLGVTLAVQPTQSWADSLRLMEQGGCDVVPMLNDSPDRRRYMDFSDSFFQEDTLIITRDDVSYLEGMNALSGKKVGIVKGYRLEEVIRKDHPDIIVVTTATMAEAMSRVSDGELFATFEALRTSMSLMQQLGLGNLKISGQTSYPNAYRVGVRKDAAWLVSAINKAIVAMPSATAHEIVERGMRLPVVEKTNYRRLWQIGSVATLAGALLLFWTYKVRQFNRVLARKNAELEHLSETDHLTGIYNRLKLDVELQKEVERAHRHERPLSVILFDLDLFKQVNDRFGHPTGDAVLIAVASVVRNNIRKTDCCGRWGGEEFLVVCTECDPEAAAQLAEKLRAALPKGYYPDAIMVTGSFGVASLQPDEAIESLIQRVDQALYEAKQSGRNRLCVAS